jgi:general secretion pathway protein A
LLIPHYKLETNPFSAEGVRPFFSSESMRYAQLKLEHALDGRIQSLYLSGPAGVGKSALVSQHLEGRNGLHLSWVDPAVQHPAALLRQLARDIGPGDIASNLSELRNIIEVFLRHQIGQNRASMIVVDSVERLALPVIRELEALCRLRLRHKPLVHCVMITRNEDLIANLIAHQQDRRPGAAVHQRLAGFTLEETTAYIRACLHSAGCEWAEELFPEEALLDVQAFTKGVVGDIDALCREALDAVAAHRDELRQPRVTRAFLKEAATRLNLRYDPTPWRQRSEELLSPESVQVSAPGELRILDARLTVTSGGRAVAEIALDRPRMVLGRDSSCDISLDSSYVSRYQNLFMETPDGWLLFDLNSTNGCFVNGRRVREHRLRDGDLIAVGQHQLRFTCPSAGEAAPNRAGEDTAVSPQPVVGKRA